MIAFYTFKWWNHLFILLKNNNNNNCYTSCVPCQKWPSYNCLFNCWILYSNLFSFNQHKFCIFFLELNYHRPHWSEIMHLRSTNSAFYLLNEEHKCTSMRLMISKFQRNTCFVNFFIYCNLCICRHLIGPIDSFPLWDDRVWGAGFVALNRFVSDSSGACVALVYMWPFDSL